MNLSEKRSCLLLRGRTEQYERLIVVEDNRVEDMFHNLHTLIEKLTGREFKSARYGVNRIIIKLDDGEHEYEIIELDVTTF